MGWNRILYGEQKSQKGRAAKEQADKEARTKKLVILGALSAVGVLVLAIVLYAVLKGGRKGTTDPDVKLRLERLVELYTECSAKKGKPPPNEQAFKDYLRSLPKEERDKVGMGDDVDGFLVSPRDGQKYVIRYGQTPDPSQMNRAFAWEQAGKDGKRWVWRGYVDEHDEQSFGTLRK